MDRRAPGAASCAARRSGPSGRGRPTASCEVTVTALTLVITTVVMMNVVHLNPLNPGADLVFDQTTPTGGDMGAHVWGPAYLRDHLLPHFQLSGWSMDWYAGMPIYRFYMVVPALAIVALDTIAPVRRGVQARRRLRARDAAVLLLGVRPAGPLPLPDARAVRVRRAGFALDESFSIYGGNLKSTMAGEFSFSIALSLVMLGLGLLAAAMQTGRLPLLGGDRAGAGRRQPRHRRHLRRARRRRHRPASCIGRHRRASGSLYGLGVGRRRGPAVGVRGSGRSSATTST